MSLQNVHRGDKVTIHDQSRKLIGIGECDAEWKTKIHIRSIRGVVSGDYSRRGSYQKGNYPYYAHPADEASVAEANRLLDERNAEKDRQEETKRKAEYDALPEAIKLARKLCFFCDTTSEKGVAQVPIELLHGIVQWAEENGKEE